ncbi:MAG: helix-turn-helix domain-containing protein [Planctomycetota bacterium]
MPRKASFMKLTPEQYDELTSFISRNEKPGGDVRASIRGRTILASHRGMTVKTIAYRFGFTERIIWAWRAVYEKYGVKGLQNPTTPK